MNRQLLVIDDDRAIHDLVNAHMSGSKTECIFAFDGVEGLQMASDCSPFAILLDMDMPRMNGMDVCRRLKANSGTRDIPVMFLTSDRTMRSKVQGIDLGACDYLTKPFDPQELRARVGSVRRAADAVESNNRLAGVDHMTGLWNKAFLQKQIEAVVAAASRAKLMVQCSFLTLDRFDLLAERMGQPGGADLLRDAAELLSSAVRMEDFVCRYDLRKLAVLSLIGSQQMAITLADRLRYSIGSIGLRSFIEAEEITCSIGSAISSNSVGPMILQTALEAHARAVQAGNSVVIASADAPVQNSVVRQLN